jgi:hypothetical protein
LPLRFYFQYRQHLHLLQAEPMFGNLHPALHFRVFDGVLIATACVAKSLRIIIASAKALITPVTLPKM